MIKYILLLGLLSLFRQSDTTSPKKIDSWTHQFDFDNDGINDVISYSYTGGAHCCYEIELKLSTCKKRNKVPFLIEGGYLFFDLSQPDNFNILDVDKDGFAEIHIYAIHKNGEKEKIYIDFVKKKGSTYHNSLEFKAY